MPVLERRKRQSSPSDLFTCAGDDDEDHRAQQCADGEPRHDAHLAITRERIVDRGGDYEHGRLEQQHRKPPATQPPLSQPRVGPSHTRPICGAW
jgi:hypothetical protein